MKLLVEEHLDQDEADILAAADKINDVFFSSLAKRTTITEKYVQLQRDHLEYFREKEPIKYVYLTKFLRQGLPTDLALQFIGLGHSAPELSYSYRYEDPEEFLRVFKEVSTPDILAIINLMIVRFQLGGENDWPTVDQLVSFSDVTKEIPDTVFEIRWLLSGGEL